MDNTIRLQYLDAMGVQLWEQTRRQEALPATEQQHMEAELSRSDLIDSAAEEIEQEKASKVDSGFDDEQSWESLANEVAICTACRLHETRTQTVFGVGDRLANCMVIGEAPGAEEDRQGEPFVGRAGLLLNEMLRALGFAREQVFIANILKCRPPNNRDPQPEEMFACESFLKRQIASLKPRIILAVGRVAAQHLLKTDSSLGRLRGKIHRYDSIPVVVFYHPAYLLRSPLEKRKAWEDVCLALKAISKV